MLATAFGTTMIRSAVAGNEVLEPLINRQIYFALAGLVVIFVVAAIDYRYWISLYIPMYIVMGIFLFSLFLSAQAVFGAARWFTVGVLFLQPTEFAKIVIILILARYFEKNQDRPRDLRWSDLQSRLGLGVGNMDFVAAKLEQCRCHHRLSGLCLLWLNGLELKHSLTFGAAGVVSLGTVVGLTFFGIRIPFLQEYQQDRIANFILPDPNATFGATYNVQQALIAIGSGGLFGKGIWSRFTNPVTFFEGPSH